jgi:hypothetical protein
VVDFANCLISQSSLSLDDLFAFVICTIEDNNYGRSMVNSQLSFPSELFPVGGVPLSRVFVISLISFR